MCLLFTRGWLVRLCLLVESATPLYSWKTSLRAGSRALAKPTKYVARNHTPLLTPFICPQRDVLSPGVAILQESCCDEGKKKAVLKTSCAPGTGTLICIDHASPPSFLPLQGIP